jgi:alpha-glucosidase (family GH31 glycosyl hydrolase)
LIYTPGGRDVEDKNIPMDVYHSNGYKEIDTHSLFGTMETMATHKWFEKNKSRTFIISRSSFAGHGKFGSRWLGDNDATTTYMGQSVTGIMMQNMFGIPFVGSDICGFSGDTNGELCARWHGVGAF